MNDAFREMHDHRCRAMAELDQIMAFAHDVIHSDPGAVERAAECVHAASEALRVSGDASAAIVVMACFHAGAMKTTGDILDEITKRGPKT